MVSPRPFPPLTDSPWFWVLVFALMAIAGTLVVGPRYVTRQGVLQRRYEVREDLRRQAAEGRPPGADSPAEQPGPPPDPVPGLSLAPIVAVLAVVAAIAWVALRIDRRRIGMAAAGAAQSMPDASYDSKR